MLKYVCNNDKFTHKLKTSLQVALFQKRDGETASAVLTTQISCRDSEVQGAEGL